MNKLIFSLLLIIEFSGFSQINSQLSFKNFILVRNIDSLELAVYKSNKNPKSYLNGLITLEINRMGYIGWFGKDLNTIKNLAYQLKSNLAIGMYYYLEGYNLLESKPNQAIHSTLKAINYFESTKDTSGMISSYYSILKANILGLSFTIDSLHSSKYYYQKIVSMGQKSSFLPDKIIMLRAMTNFQELVDGDYAKVAPALIKDNLLFIEKNHNIEPYEFYIYSNLARLYSLLSENKLNYLKKSLYYSLKVFKALSIRSSRTDIISCLNVGLNYIDLKDYDKASIFIKKGIDTFDKLDASEKNNKTLSILYEQLAEIQKNKKEYLASNLSLKKSISIIKNKNFELKKGFFEELKTQFEFEENKIENLKLNQTNSLINNQNKQFRIISSVLIFSFLIVLTLVYFLYKNIEEKKNLIKFRDELFIIISHDLRSPITNFQQYSSIISYLINTKQFEKLQAATLHFDQIGTNLNLLLNNLLSWGLIQQKKTVYKYFPEKFNIKEFLNNLLPIYRNQAAFNSIQIIEEVKELNITTDKHALELIIRNLLDNSIKYSCKENNIIIKTELINKNMCLSLSNQSTAFTAIQIKTIKDFFDSNNENIEGKNPNFGIGFILIKKYAKIINAKIIFDFTQENTFIFKIFLQA